MDSNITSRFRFELLSKFISTIISGLLIVILARILPSDTYGLLFLTISILSVSEIFSKFGIPKSTAHFLSKYKEKKNKDTSVILKSSVVPLLIAIIITCSLILIFRVHISLILDEPDLVLLLVIGCVFVALRTITGHVRTILQGFERIQAASIIQASERFLRFVFVTVLVLLGAGATGALVGYVVSYLIIAVVGSLYVYYYLYQNKVKLDTNSVREITRYAVPLSVTDGAVALDRQVDTILVGFFISPVAVAFYTISKQLLQFIETPLYALGFTLSPTLNAQKAQKNIKVASNLYKEAIFHSLWVYIPAAVGLVLVASPTIEIIFGAEYIGAVPVLQVFAIYLIPIAITSITSNALDFLGRAKERAIVRTLTAIVNVILNLILIPWLGVVGAAYATVISHSIYGMFCLYLMNTELRMEFKSLFTDTMSIMLITATMALPTYYIVEKGDGVITLIGSILTGIIVWSLISIPFGFLTKDKIRALVQ